MDFNENTNIPMLSDPSEITIASELYLKDGDLSHLKLTGKQAYTSHGYLGQGAIVAVLDTGVTRHTELGLRLIDRISCCKKETSVEDWNGHGSHVAGIIAGTHVGVAPLAKIVSIKVLDQKGGGTQADVIKGIEAAIAWRGENGEKINIINMSLAASGTFYDMFPSTKIPYETAINKATAAEIAVICAAGNSGKEETQYPACFQEVIAVGAVDVSEEIAYFSTSNSQVDICQVGVGIFSLQNAIDNVVGNKYCVKSGTSMASPMVAGIAALIVSKYKTLFEDDVTEDAIWHMLKINTLDLGKVGYDILYGAGLCTLDSSIGTVNIEMFINQKRIKVNNEYYNSDIAPMLVDVNGGARTMIPVRFVSEAFGAQVGWNQELKKVTIKK